VARDRSPPLAGGSRNDLPWTNEDCRRAGTLHLRGTASEIVAAEAATVRGQLADRPFVLAGQQYLADPSRLAGPVNPLWAYAHVPYGYTGDASEAVTAQIDRFAPGFRDQILATATRRAPEMAAYTCNYVGGDSSSGANTPGRSPRAPAWPSTPTPSGSRACTSAPPPRPRRRRPRHVRLQRGPTGSGTTLTPASVCHYREHPSPAQM
jgi:phytoene dehydrogenase-like protein